MKPQELRVGNEIWRPCCCDEVVEIRENGIIGLDSLRGIIPFSEIKPIPITPQWLIDNGFTDGTVLTRKNVQITPITLDTWKVIINCDNYKTELRRNIRYIHELQNCYYQATGKELCER